MTVGAKIRKYRELFNLTQKELGLKSGFSEMSADVRIRQYETNKMIPKAGKLQEIANALDVPLSSLVNRRLNNNSDFMGTLFDMEDKYGLTVDKRDDEYILVMNNLKNFKSRSQADLADWYKKKEQITAAVEDSSLTKKEAETVYAKWKAQYPKNVIHDLVALEMDLLKKFQPLIDKLTPFKPRTLDEYVRHFELMAKSRIQIEIVAYPTGTYYSVYAARFFYRQLASLDGEAAVLFAKHLTMIDYLKQLHIPVKSYPNSFEDNIYIDHIIPYDLLYIPMDGIIRKMLEHVYNNTMTESPFKEEYKTELDRISHKEIKDADEAGAIFLTAEEKQLLEKQFSKKPTVYI